MKTSMKIYIAGKVTGLPIHQVTMKFGQAQKEIERQGHIAVNPLQVVNDWHMPWKQAMRKCITALMGCDAILLLPDWMTSEGASLEGFIAEKLDIRILNGTRDLKRRIELP